MNVVGILLAGGESRRMGTPKALLDRHGQPLWKYVRDAMLAAGCTRVLVSGDFPREIPQAIPDTTTGLGPLGGIATVVAGLPPAQDGCTLLVVPVDLPLLDTATLRDLLVYEPRATAAHYATHALPARLRLNDGLRAALDNCLADPDPRRHSLQALAAALHAVQLPLAATTERALTNANTPEDWARALR